MINCAAITRNSGVGSSPEAPPAPVAPPPAVEPPTLPPRRDPFHSPPGPDVAPFQVPTTTPGPVDPPMCYEGSSKIER